MTPFLQHSQTAERQWRRMEEQRETNEVQTREDGRGWQPACSSQRIPLRQNQRSASVDSLGATVTHLAACLQANEQRQLHKYGLRAEPIQASPAKVWRGGGGVMEWRGCDAGRRGKPRYSEYMWGSFPNIQAPLESSRRETDSSTRRTYFLPLSHSGCCSPPKYAKEQTSFDFSSIANSPLGSMYPLCWSGSRPHSATTGSSYIKRAFVRILTPSKHQHAR